MSDLIFPKLGTFPANGDLIRLETCSDGNFATGKNGVTEIAATGDRKVEFIAFGEQNKTICYVKSAMGYPAYYPIEETKIEKPLKAVMMDLDGTSVRSEEFWIWIIEMTTASMLGNPRFELEEADLPFVSGHSVSEHLQYCIKKYCPGESVDKAREFYFEHTHREMKEIMEGRGREGAFVPVEGIKEFLLELKDMGVKIGLVTSGLYEKAWPEILDAFRTLKMGDPKDFYDAIITAGFPLRKGDVGTLGELSPKPHPWLYAEVARVGLGIDPEYRNQIIGIEDSGAGVCSVRLGNFPTVGVGGGNIESSGTKSICDVYCEKLEDVLKVIK
ncbi:MAG: HAD family phosphatase [Oscillospiraceae bacterium]|nr:HAD family phosphatase [Oscillospiraceae bacterium]